MSIRFIPLACAIAFTLVLRCQAQTPAFADLELGVSVAGDLESAHLQRDWTIGPLVSAWAESPFYAGRIRLGIDTFGADSRSTAGDRFRAVFLNASFGDRVTVRSGRLWVGGAVVLGDFIMRFPAEEQGFREFESELGAGVTGEVAFKVTSRISLRLAGTYTRVFTSVPIELSTLGAGLSANVAMPSWLREGLK